ncbi:MAG: DUF460 domain-containing protein [Candidatus Heimdallarchaeota archaeon]|nr:DUF460 domain-containing protein [Candidatus Heimdallarchaeota archaeon]
MATIIGIDILPGASSQKDSSYRTNRFAAVVIKDNEVIETVDATSPKKIIKLCRKHEPLFLGVDNIFELESNSARVIQFCSQLPLGTRIIQVTGAPPHGFEPLNRLARRNNIPYPSKQHANPIQSAEIIARLAEKKVGYILLPFEDETEIKISRTRSIGPGGWSQQRYSRRMRGEILRITREIEDQLENHDIDYDLETRKTKYGYDNAVFRAYAPLRRLRKIVKPYKGELARVVIQPIRKKRVEFIPASGSRGKITTRERRKSNRGLIVGIDPGHNTGIGILNFAGKIMHVGTLRSVARGDVIREITEIGDPIIIAADVTPPPSFVEKIAKMLKATLYYPDKLLSAMEKKQIVDDFTEDQQRRVKGSHKRDALSAAIKAYHHFEGLLEKINKELQAPEDLPLRNKVKKIVLKEGRNIQETIQLVREQQKKIERPIIKQEEEKREFTELEKRLQEKVESLKELIERQMTQIDNLEDMNQDLTKKLNEAQKERGRLKRKIKRITRKRNQELRRDETIKRKDDEIRFLREKSTNLERELQKYKKIISDLKRMIVMNATKVIVPMKVVREFSREGIEETVERMNIEPYDVVLLMNPSGGGQNTAELLIEKDVRAIVCAENNISDPAMEAFIKANVPVLFDMPIRQIDDIAVTYFDELEQAIKDWEDQRERIQKEKTERKLATLIAEYQSQRKKELKQIYKKTRGKKESDHIK